jgi:hypothetical protein
MKERLLAKGECLLQLRNQLEKDIAKHYQQALSKNCRDILWSNEGLYLLNSVREYNRLFQLFSEYSTEVVCVCCFRDIESYTTSYMKQLMKLGLSLNNDKESYRYLSSDSWLFDYDRKKDILYKVFEEVICLSYSPKDMVRTFMESLGYSVSGTENIRLNITQHS